MNRKDGLVPIGEVFGGLDGPVKTIREAPPKTLHHFTQIDQVAGHPRPRTRLWWLPPISRVRAL